MRRSGRSSGGSAVQRIGRRGDESVDGRVRSIAVATKKPPVAPEGGRRLTGRGQPVLSRKPSSCRLRTGCCSLRTALASIWRTRSRVTLKIRPTSSSV